MMAEKSQIYESQKLLAEYSQKQGTTTKVIHLPSGSGGDYWTRLSTASGILKTRKPHFGNWICFRL
jgi:hypothetical protein